MEYGSKALLIVFDTAVCESMCLPHDMKYFIYSVDLSSIIYGR